MHDFLKQSYDGPVVVQFSGSTCPPCQVMKPIITKLQNERKDFTFIVIDAWKNPDLAFEFGIRGVPDVRLFRDGKQVAKMRAIPNPKLITEWLDTEIYSVS